LPLRCLDPKKNSSIHAFDLSPEEWRALELENRAVRHLRMPCCSSKVVLKKSRHGTQFFAHKAVGECATAPETEIHLRLKQMAVYAARANGWDAETEVAGSTPSGEQWKADVLARKGDHKVAVEMQWSAQTIEEAMRRQARYEQSGVRCLWLLRVRQSNDDDFPHNDLPVDRALPVAGINRGPEGFIALVPTGGGWQQKVPVQVFLEAAFSKRLRFGVPVGVAAKVSVRAGHLTCWSCGSETRIITGVDLALATYEYQFSVFELDQYPDLLDTVRSRLPNNLCLGVIKRRFSRKRNRSYLSNGCAHCDALIGASCERDAWDDQESVCEFPIRVNERWRQAIEGNDCYVDGWSVYP
jgi:Competence protein CoiA-like family